MTDLDLKIAELETRLDRLVRTQIDFQTEITRIRSELAGLRAGNRIGDDPQRTPQTNLPPEPVRSSEPVRPRPEPRPYPQPERPVSPPTFATSSGRANTGSSAKSESAFSQYVSSYTESARADLEKFIGENLISKIGIIVLVLGVGIGAKYAIDNNLISPLARIIIGYIFGFGLVGLAIKLKPKYLNFSSVLISGGMAIMYFVTYFAYASYSLMPQSAAFALMAMFTVFTVAAALLYNRQVIAHIGLVGAYAVPFLLSNNSGNYLVLFAYMAIINIGILAISVKKYWKPLFYTSSGFTWLIFFGWFISKYSAAEHFYLALVFLAVFFAIFYATKIVHGVLHAESGDSESLVAIFVTAFIFYGFCFAISDVKADIREYTAFFTYLAVMSLAILITSYRFYGRVLVYLSYPFTWLIFAGWLLDKYRVEEHFYLAAIFAVVFFLVYYAATIIYRLINDEVRLIENSGLILTNSFIFYGVGYSIIESRESLHGFAGIFTAAHALLHFVVAQIVIRLRSSAVDVVQVLTILILTFATITIPVQFDGNYVTLMWSVEAALLFWFGRVKQIWLFEYFLYPIMLLATGSLFADWATAYGDRTSYVSEFNRQPIANGDFITAIVFIAAFAFIYITNRDERHEPAIDVDLIKPFGYMVAGVGLLVLYNTFRLEISNYYHVKGLADTAEMLRETALPDSRFNILWQLNYTMFFLTAMWFVNIRKVRSVILAYAGIGFSLFSLLIFVSLGMRFFFELRESYMLNEAGLMNISIRYISYLFAAVLLYTLYNYSRDKMLTDLVPPAKLKMGYDGVVYGTILIVASCELVNLMGQFYISDAYKLGLSVLWGIYALVLIVIGIVWSKKHLRIGAIVLLAVTLAKLFLYDIAELDTIPKTILFMTLGITMLVVSFLYNKYKAVIFPIQDETEE
jgi:uncharacterized membrane protein